MKRSLTLLVIAILSSLTAASSRATDDFSQEIERLNNGIRQLRIQIQEHEKDIAEWKTSMTYLTLEAALAGKSLSPDEVNRNAERERSIAASREKIQHFEGQISDNEGKIEQLGRKRQRELLENGRSQQSDQGDNAELQSIRERQRQRVLEDDFQNQSNAREAASLNLENQLREMNRRTQESNDARRRQSEEAQERLEEQNQQRQQSMEETQRVIRESQQRMQQNRGSSLGW